MLHNFTVTAPEAAQIRKTRYYVIKPIEIMQPGDGVVFTIEGTRDQLQAAVSDVNRLFKSAWVVALDHLSAEEDIPATVGGGPALH